MSSRDILSSKYSGCEMNIEKVHLILAHLIREIASYRGVRDQCLGTVKLFTLFRAAPEI